LKKGFKVFLISIIGALPSLGSSFYSGSDTACFYGSPKTSCTLSSSKSSFGLAIGGGPLFFTPDSGFSSPTIAGGVVDLGAFSVNKSLLGGEAGTFDIDVTFTAPAGAGGKKFTASTLGVIVLGKGGVEVTFDNPVTQVFTYPGGSFDLTLPGSTILIGAGQNYTLDGIIAECTTNPVAEPVPLATVGLSLVLIAFVARRRVVSRKASIL